MTADQLDLTNEQIIIVTTFSDVIVWLAQNGIRGKVLSYIAHPSQIENKVVIGNVPFWLASYAKVMGSIYIPDLTDEQKNNKKHLSAQEMTQANAYVRWFRVKEIEANTLNGRESSQREDVEYMYM